MRWLIMAAQPTRPMALAEGAEYDAELAGPLSGGPLVHGLARASYRTARGRWTGRRRELFEAFAGLLHPVGEHMPVVCLLEGVSHRTAPECP